MRSWHKCKYTVALMVIIAAGLSATAAQAAARFARTTGNWTTLTWSGTSCAAGAAAVPVAADDVTICDNVTVTVNTTTTVKSITIPAGGNPAILQINSAQTLTVTGNVAATAGTGTGDNKQILLSNNAVLNVNGSLTLTGNGNDNRIALLQLNGATVTIDGDLNIDGAGGNNRAQVTLANTSTLNVTGDLTIGTGGLLSNGSSTSSVVNLNGDFTQSGVSDDYSSTGGVFQLLGTGAQALNGAAAAVTTFYRLVINKPSGDVTLGHNVVVAGGAATSVLALTQGRIITGANSISVGAAGATTTTITGAGTANYVIGNMRRYIPTGTQTGIIFPVGGTTAGKYTPVQIDFPNVTTAGYFQVAAATGNTDHPNIATSALNASESVNRYWTLTNTGGLTFSGVTTANVTFNYPSSDIDGGADTSAFIAGEFASSAWTYPATGTLGATSTQVTGLTAATIVGDFAVAELTGPYSYWRMNESSWNGTAGEVADFGSGGNAGNAASLSATKPSTTNTSPAIAGSPGTCRYGVFNRANKDYVSLPTTYPNLTTQSFTVTAWIRTTDRTQPGQRILIDDETEAGGWGFSLADSGTAGALRLYSRGSATQTLDTAGVINNNTWYFVAASISINGTTTVANMYVYTTAGAVAGTANATWTGFTWGNDPGRPSIGGETNASGEATNLFGFAGNIDEVRIYRVALSQGLVNQVRQLTNPCETTDHYSLVGSTTAVTCDVAAVQVIAHDTVHTAVSPAAGTVLSLSTSTTTGVWQAGLQAGSGAWTPSGANNGLATYVWPGGETTFTVYLRHSTVASVGINVLDSNFKAESPTEDLSIAFVDSAFRVTADGTTTATIGTQLSGKNSNTGFGSQTLYLQAIRTDTNTGSCVGAFQSQTATIQMAGNRVNPTGGSSQVSVLNSGGTMTALGTGAGVPGTYTNVTLAFDAQSKAPLVINYPDAGSVSIHAQYQLPTPPAATFFTGSSNGFVVRPFGFAFRGANSATAIQHGTTDTSALLAPAGDNFTMTLSAYQWAAGEDTNNDGIPDAGVNLANNGLTPNFASSVSIAATGNLPGNATGAISRGATCASTPTIAAGSFSGGSATITDWCYSEAGNVFLTATSADYLVAGVNISGNSGMDGTAAAGGYVGRFRPKNFAISGTPARLNRSAASCSPASSFTYMGEALSLTFTLVARNTQGATTLNYNGTYAKLGLGTPANFAFGARGGTTDLTARIDPATTTTGTWVSGVTTITAVTGIVRAASPDGPYATVQFGIAPVDSDTVAMNLLDFDADGNSVNERTNLGVTADLRFGRMRLNNAFGSTLLDLPLQLTVEYHNGSVFVTNAADNCTTLLASDMSFSFVPGTNLGPTCETQMSPNGTLAFTSGAAPVKLTKPGAVNDGAVDLTINLGAASGSTCIGASASPATGASKTWLQGNWGTTSFNGNPQGRASFGQFKSTDQFLYLREVY